MHNYHTFISHRVKNGFGHSTFGQLNMKGSIKYTGVDGVHGRTRRITSHKTSMLISDGMLCFHRFRLGKFQPTPDIKLWQ